jgi:Tol biopolymer transport system component
MDPVRHTRAAQLFLDALALPPEQQHAFLLEQCGSDSGLLQLVQALLDEDRNGPIIGESHAPEYLCGKTVSRYRILESIPGGGMSTVYRALDTRLERTVALKFLPPSLSARPASRERFLREARAMASIDHPNVCPVYEVAEADGYTFLAMAHLHGTPLSDKIIGAPLAVDYAIDVALQTARGLEAAHAKGLVHRDIKPANLMLIDTGAQYPLVRILDFGIALSAEDEPLTEEGVTMGTISYMAPEQIAGSRVDARADLWSLGVVLYEMLSGRLPFSGATQREVLAAIAGPEAAATSILPAIPDGLRSVLRRSLDKNPDKRYPAAAKLVADLEQVSKQFKGTDRHGLLQRRKTLMLVTAPILAAMMIAIAWLKFGPAVRQQQKVIPFTFYPGDEITPAISPDGKQIAFSGQGKDGTNPFEVYVQLIGSTDPLRLTHAGAPFADRYPKWDPTGSRIAFLRARGANPFGRILVVPALGGAETDLGVEKVLAGGGLDWHPGGRTIAYASLTAIGNTAIFELNLADRTIRQRTFPTPGENDCCPQFDPTGRRLAFRRNEAEIAIVGEQGGTTVLPVRSSWPGLAWSTDGKSLFYSWYGKLAQADLKGRWRVRTDLALEPDVTSPSIRGARMAFVRWDFQHSIWQLQIRHTGAALSPSLSMSANAPLILSTARDDSPQFSPDGNYIAFASERSGWPNIWISSSNGSALRPLTHYEEQSAGTPRWSPDSRSLAFDLREPSANPQVYVALLAGGKPRKLTAQRGGADVPSWSHDGHFIYFHSRADDQIWKIPPSGGQADPVTHRGAFEGFESADGHSLYFSKSDSAGIWRMDLVSGREAAIPGLDDAGAFRQWTLSRNGIYYVRNAEAGSENPAIWFYDFSTRHSIRAGTAGKLITAGPGAMAVSPDEAALLYVHSDRDNRDVMLVENFR